MDPFDEMTTNVPIALTDRRMVASTFENCDLTASRFHRVHIKEATFDDVDLSRCVFRDVTLGGATITMSSLTEARIDGDLTGVVINGVPLKDLFAAYEKITGTQPD